MEFWLSKGPLARVDFGSSVRQKAFFFQARRSFANWRDLFDKICKITDTQLTLRKLKRWRLGQALPVLDVVQTICRLTGKELCDLGVEIRPVHWGQQKGGNKKVAKHGCNLTLRDRMMGGRMTGRSNSIVHMKTIVSVGGSNSIRSNRHPFRRVDGPNGIRMLDDLERDVIMKLVSAGFDAVYEPVIKIGLRRLIPDFRIGATYIECTRNQKANAKSAKLIERFHVLREHVKFRKGIVVTLPFLVDKYRHYLPPDIDVATSDNLPSSII
jgi:hypothetical protein